MPARSPTACAATARVPHGSDRDPGSAASAALPHLVVKQMVQMKNRVSGLLMETGVSYNKQWLHKVGYFGELTSTNGDISNAVRPLLKLSRCLPM